MRTAVRLFVLPWYLVGWVVHLYLGLFAAQTYLPLGSTALIPGYTELWRTAIVPHMHIFAALLAGFELVVGLLLLSGGGGFRVGVALSIAFNLFLIQMGLGYDVAGWMGSFAVNRLPNLMFIGIQLPLLLGPEALPMSKVTRGWVDRMRWRRGSIDG